MDILPVSLPPGMYKNGTPYTRRGRWTDGNHVRWHDGAVRPIGGWSRLRSGGAEINALFADPTAEAVRDIFAWRSNAQDPHTVLGSNLALYHLSSGGVVTDITPVGYAATNPTKDADILVGFGGGPFGLGAFGAANNTESSEASPPNRWYFTNFGEVLLTGSRNNGGLFEVDPATLTPVSVANAPDDIQDAVVTRERQVLAIGGDGEPRRVQTSDLEDRTSWTPTISNQSIDRTLPGTGRLLRCRQVGRDILILGEADAHIARYVGPPYILSVDLVGENCGPLSAEALVTTDRFAVWLGERTFWYYDGTVQVLKCEVIDYLWSDIDLAQASKVQAFTNTQFSEVWWLYQSKSTTTTEVDKYVVWNYLTQAWYVGTIDRTAGYDAGVRVAPIMVSSGGLLYNHELSDVYPADEGAVYIESGALELGNGEKNMAVRFLYPDAETVNDVSFELITRQLPLDTEYTYGPYTLTNPTPTRAMGRSVKLKANLLTASSELGHTRMEYAPLGTGKR